MPTFEWLGDGGLQYIQLSSHRWTREGCNAFRFAFKLTGLNSCPQCKLLGFCVVVRQCREGANSWLFHAESTCAHIRDSSLLLQVGLSICWHCWCSLAIGTACSLGCVVMLPADMMQETLILWQSHFWTPYLSVGYIIRYASYCGYNWRTHIFYMTSASCLVRST
jgi:hypothetical protein